MIGFSQYLAEARMAPLYHYAGAGQATFIVAEDWLRTGKDTAYGRSQRYGKDTIFFTRSFNHAKEFAKLKNAAHDRGVVFEIDQQKLSQRYKISPIHNWSNQYHAGGHKIKYDQSKKDYGSEAEEFVDRDIKEFLSYVTTIHYFPGFADSEDQLRTFFPDDFTRTLRKYPNIKIKKI